MEKNLLPPYQHQLKIKDTYTFITDSNVEYVVYFESEIQDFLKVDYPELSSKFFEFGFMPISVKVSEVSQYPPDERILITVVNILKEYFAHNENAIIYNCLTIDGKQKARARYFEAIFQRAKQNEILKFDSIIDAENDIQYFQSLLIKNNNPDLETMVQAFYRIAFLLGE